MTDDPPAGPAPSVPAALPEAARLRWSLARNLQEIALASERYVDVAARTDGVHRTDLHALNEILRNQDADAPLTASELAARLGLSAPATTALIDRLEGHGHVSRERDARDRRRVAVLATDEARSTGSRIFRPLASALGTLADSYTEDELRLIDGFLSRAATTIEQAADPGGRD
ncbi:MarR family winged helix-turn-helix transcriptional regulator [Zhihengliuella salsuginis]|uniref:HTH marR-type domain-containing protein n=1 Tax=Zhihengliuella salsuginis TaxID=578222 RepID=A0ABQ3GDL4_9MICC|nr:MarR family transcriptional regulator [Zhihengliuella salsuginis]GHD02683.1 hypothetical protein GCM10008096_08090 [Zhihengliuella salsuginis]